MEHKYRFFLPHLKTFAFDEDVLEITIRPKGNRDIVLIETTKESFFGKDKFHIDMRHMQMFTNLVSYNGVEIYEGDYLELLKQDDDYEKEEMFEVVYHNGAFRKKYKFWPRPFLEGLYPVLTEADARAYVVIGNNKHNLDLMLPKPKAEKITNEISS